MEPVMWAYGYGRPKERLEISLTHDLSHLSAAELLDRADQLRQELLEAAAEEASIPAEFRIEAPKDEKEDS
jgi:hypothetical protein